MTLGNSGPPTLLLAEGDFRSLRGLTLFTRGGTPVAAPTDAPRFEDLLQALCSYGSQVGASLQEDAQAAWDASGAPASVITAGVDSDDLAWVHSTTTAFTLTPTGSAWGFPAGATASTPSGGGHIVRATQPWTRGKFVFGAGGNSLSIDPAGAAAAFTTPSYVGAATSLIVLMRHSALADADTARLLNCLEYWDNEANDPALRRLRWGMDNTGRVFSTRPDGVSARPSWVNTTLMQALGFTFNEIEVASGTLRTLTGTNEAAFGIMPLGLRRCEPWRDEDCDVLELRDGSAAVQDLAERSGWEVEVYLAGPAMQAADLTQHWHDRFLPRARRNHGITVFRWWGDTRRDLPLRSITSTQPAHDLLYTSSGYGRLRCVRDPGDAGRRLPAYLGSPAVLNQQMLILRNRVD